MQVPKCVRAPALEPIVDSLRARTLVRMKVMGRAYKWWKGYTQLRPDIYNPSESRAKFRTYLWREQLFLGMSSWDEGEFWPFFWKRGVSISPIPSQHVLFTGLAQESLIFCPPKHGLNKNQFQFKCISTFSYYSCRANCSALSYAIGQKSIIKVLTILSMKWICARERRPLMSS